MKKLKYIIYHNNDIEINKPLYYLTKDKIVLEKYTNYNVKTRDLLIYRIKKATSRINISIKCGLFSTDRITLVQKMQMYIFPLSQFENVIPFSF